MYVNDDFSRRTIYNPARAKSIPTSYGSINIYDSHSLFIQNNRALSLSGFLSASTVGCLLIFLYGIQFHFVLLASFFTLSLALNLLIKKIIILKSKHSKRNVVQVLCNGGIPLLLCIISYFKQNPHYHYLFAASVATAMADTWATEFGKLSKVKPISIIH